MIPVKIERVLTIITEKRFCALSTPSQREKENKNVESKKNKRELFTKISTRKKAKATKKVTKKYIQEEYTATNARQTVLKNKIIKKEKEL